MTFYPSRLQGSAAVPPAKSEAHRALLLAALAQAPCELTGFTPPLCDDTEAMINGIVALGTRVEREGSSLRVTPAPSGAERTAPVTCHVNACAAALRMLIPVYLIKGQSVRFTMDAALSKRPLNAFEPLCQALGATMRLVPPDESGTAALELGGLMPAGSYEIDGSQSSQFASGMLIALAHAADKQGKPTPATLTVTQPIVSRPYLDMTLELMKRFGISVEERSEGVFTLAPAKEQPALRVPVSGDWSQAAVLLCANAIGGGVMLEGMEPSAVGALQGDARVLEALGAMGLRMLMSGGELYAVSPSRDALCPLTLDCSDIPDIAPILALTCTQARGRSVLTGVGRLRIKECDRLQATVELLSQLGAHAESDGDALTIYGKTKLRGGFTADAHGDHRMVMLLAVAASIADAPITVTGVEAISKSWPGFWETYRMLGGIAR